MAKLLFRMAIGICCLCAILMGLAPVFGGNLPKTVLAFIAHCQGDSQVYLYDWERGLSVRLSHGHDRLIGLPTWSPDGQQIAYTRETANKGPLEILLTDLQTGNTRKLIPATSNEPVSVRSPVWSPDGRYLAYVSAIHNVASIRISIMELATGEVIEYPMNSTSTYPPVWSSNSRFLAFHRGFSSEITILDMTTGKFRSLPIYPPNESNLYPNWSPDGHQLAFIVWQNTSNKLYTADVASLTPFNPLGDSVHSYTYAAWSPDGQMIATIVNSYEIHILNLSGEMMRQFNLRGLLGPLVSISWSSDGNFIAIKAVHKTDTDNYLINTVDGTIRDISLPNCSHESVVWSP